MKRTVYVETSVISYLTARPSRTILGAAHQQVTLAWWERRSRYELLVSRVVWQECAAGDPEAARTRLAAMEGLGMLAVTQDMVELASELVTRGALPVAAAEDSLHIAIATLHRVDFLLTWNCRHIANPLVQEAIAEYFEQRGFFLPVICTPEELLGGKDDG